MTTGLSTSIERAGWWLLVATLGVVQFNLLTAQVLFGLAALCWLVVTVSDRQRPALPAFALPLGIYALLTLASAAASSNPLASFQDSKQLLLFLMVPMVARLARGPRAMQALDVILAVGAAGAIYGIVQFAIFGYDDLSNRPSGRLSHYMTYSGVLMLVTCAAAARLLYFPQRVIWPAIAVPALLTALAFTQTRNAWIGAAAGLAVLLWMRRPVLVLALPVLAAVAIVAAPASLRTRAMSMVDPTDASNRDRLQMIGMGVDMVRDHPVFGVGPEMVQRVYAEYRPKDAVHPYNPHLHNVPIQIAAERGLPALAVWLWLVVIAARDLWRQARQGPGQALAAAGLACVVAMVVAGWFEYNFGDSEVLMLFLGMITLPFAARLGPMRQETGAPSGTAAR